MKTPSTPLFLSHSIVADTAPGQSKTSSGDSVTGVSSSMSVELDVNLQQPSNIQSLSGLPDPMGLKTPQELDLFWSPSVMLGNAPSGGKSISHDSSRTSLTQQSLQPSNISSPISESAVSSAQPTPGPTSTTNAFTFKNYSPTASVDGESLMNRQMVQSAIHTPSCLEDSHSSASLEPLSQSMRVDSSFRSSIGTGSNLSSPSQSFHGGGGQAGRSQLSSSFRARIGRFINLFSPKKVEGDGEEYSELSSTAENEEFTEINVSDLERSQQRSRLAPLSVDRSAKRGILTNRNQDTRARRKIEVGEECLAAESLSNRSKPGASLPSSTTQVLLDSAAPSTRTGITSDSTILKVDKEDESSATKSDENSQTGDLLKISNLPDSSSRTSRSSSQSSQGSENGREEEEGESPLSPLNARLPDVTSEDHLQGQRRKKNRLYDERSMASSVPERGAFSSIPKRQHSRTRSSNSDHTVLMVQERLQELVESEKTSSFSPKSGESILAASDSSTAMEQSGSHVPFNRRPATLTVTSNDSTSTLRVQSPEKSTDEVSPPTTVKSSSSDAVFSGDGSGLSLKHANQASNSMMAYSSLLPNRLFMRRVSVCHRDHQLSTSGGEHLLSQSTSQINQQTSTVEHPSPLSLLDQFVMRGEILHRGQFESIPLTELEGVDWNHFGGCPHSEEFGMMRSQVALLHSQLLFERHQCLQHARRNRRLLSRARSSTQVAEKLYSLVSDLHCRVVPYCM